jgi:hypothetical protein
MAQWSLTSLQLKLIKIGAHVIRHARAITFQLAEVAVTGPMVRTMAPRSTPKLNESGRTVPSAALKNTAAEPEHGGLAV